MGEMIEGEKSSKRKERSVPPYIHAHPLTYYSHIRYSSRDTAYMQLCIWYKCCTIHTHTQASTRTPIYNTGILLAVVAGILVHGIPAGMGGYSTSYNARVGGAR